MSALLPIGRFARLTGLSVGALRHYAQIGLLPPARVDPHTGYRSYTAAQAPAARRIAALRDLEVPLPLIRQLLDVPAAEVRQRLRRYRAELEAQVWRLQRQSHRLAHYTEETPVPETTASPAQAPDHDHPHDHSHDHSHPHDHDQPADHEHGHPEGHTHSEGPDRRPLSTAALDPGDERRLAAQLFNGVWELLERPGRSTDDDFAMLHAAHASRYHWGVVGQPVHWARGEWQISRVYAVLGRAEPALHHGLRYLALVDAHGLAPFDRAYAHEAIARGYRVAGDPARQAEHLTLARAAAAAITDPEELEFLLPDLDQLAT
jgi:DNA-binding transcriptional MerR regulator